MISTTTLGVSGPADSMNDGLLCNLFQYSSDSAIDYYLCEGLILRPELYGLDESGD